MSGTQTTNTKLFSVAMEHLTRIELYLYKTSQLEYKLILELLVISLSHAPNSLNTQLFYSLYGM